MPDSRRARIEELVEAFNERRFEEYVAGFHDDAVVEYPQSGERVRGRRNLLGMFTAFAAPPTFRTWRIDTDGDTVLVHAMGDYPGLDPLFVLIEYRFNGDRIAQETAYFGSAFAPADWRKPFVEVRPFSTER